MMRETGTVLWADNKSAEVSVKRKSSCGDNCAMCKGACTAQEIKATVVNEIGAKKGDLVIVEADSKSIIKGAAFLYLLPVVLMFLAYILADSYTQNKTVAALISVGVLVVCGTIIKLFDKKLAPKTYITEIIERDVEKWL